MDNTHIMDMVRYGLYREFSDGQEALAYSEFMKVAEVISVHMTYRTTELNMLSYNIYSWYHLKDLINTTGKA